MNSPAHRSLPRDPQARRTLEGAVQPHRLGDAMMLDERGFPTVKPAEKVRAPAKGRDLTGSPRKVAAIANPGAATAADAANKANELVLLGTENARTLNELVAAHNALRAAFESFTFQITDALVRAGLMEK